MARCRRASCDRLAEIAEQYDRGYGHFTTRQNIQFNWIKLEDSADILETLAEVEMHAIQTSGNCIRNVTTDHWAGAAADEIADPRPVAELLRQWSSLHPEFSYLPRKFKIAVTGAPNDRAAVKVHDIGLRMHRERRRGARLGSHCRWRPGPHPDDRRHRARLPAGARAHRPISKRSCASTICYGRRDNKYKARIKILVHGARRRRASARRSRRNIARIVHPGSAKSTSRELERIAAYFAPPAFETLPQISAAFEEAKLDNPPLPDGPAPMSRPTGSTATASSTSR